jgi:NAD(P)-dependent dehydrogenase (short-subunit alcohol dehydrogenase family)
MRQDRFVDKVALITAGASGIGWCTAQVLGAEGARIAIVDIDETAGRAAVQRLQRAGVDASLVAADLSQPARIQEVIAEVLGRFGRIDILVNNVGAGRPGGTIVDQDEADWDWTFNICLKSAWLGMKHVLPSMVARGSGAIVNLSSLAGTRVAPNSSPAYAAAKAAVVHLTRFAAVQYAPHGIRINVVAPGLTATPAVMQALNEEERVSIIKGLHAVPRLVRPEETAATIAFLCSEESSMITGHTVPVDGGWSAR